jgi:hypothetical protein
MDTLPSEMDVRFLLTVRNTVKLYFGHTSERMSANARFRTVSTWVAMVNNRVRHGRRRPVEALAGYEASPAKLNLPALSVVPATSGSEWWPASLLPVNPSVAALRGVKPGDRAIDRAWSEGAQAVYVI